MKIFWLSYKTQRNESKRNAKTWNHKLRWAKLYYLVTNRLKQNFEFVLMHFFNLLKLHLILLFHHVRSFWVAIPSVQRSSTSFGSNTNFWFLLCACLLLARQRIGAVVVAAQTSAVEMIRREHKNQQDNISHAYFMLECAKNSVTHSYYLVAHSIHSQPPIHPSPPPPVWCSARNIWRGMCSNDFRGVKEPWNIRQRYLRDCL